MISSFKGSKAKVNQRHYAVSCTTASSPYYKTNIVRITDQIFIRNHSKNNISILQQDAPRKNSLLIASQESRSLLWSEFCNESFSFSINNNPEITSSLVNLTNDQVSSIIVPLYTNRESDVHYIKLDTNINVQQSSCYVDIFDERVEDLPYLFVNKSNYVVSLQQNKEKNVLYICPNTQSLYILLYLITF